MSINIEDIHYWHIPVADRLILAQDIIDSVLAETDIESVPAKTIREMYERCTRRGQPA